MRILPLITLILYSGCSSCSGKNSSGDGNESDTIDVPDENEIVNEDIRNDEIIPEDAFNETDIALDDSVDSNNDVLDEYSPDCIFLDYPAVDLGSLAPHDFVSTRDPFPCGENCRQVSIEDYGLYSSDYDVWGNNLAFAARNVESGSIVESRIYLIDLTDLGHKYFSRDDINDRISTDTEDKGVIQWISIHENKMAFSRLSPHSIIEQNRVEIFIYNIATNNLSLVRTYIYPCISCSARRFDLHGDILVYEDEKELLAEQVSVLNLSERKECNISIRDWGSGRPEIYDNNIVFREGKSGYGVNVYLYDVSTDAIRRLTEGSGDHYSPHIWGDNVVWTDTRNGGTELSQENADVFMIDITSEIENPVCTHPASQPQPARIWGNTIVWSDCRNDPTYPNVPSRAENLDLYMFDISSSEEAQLTSFPDRETSAKPHENKVYFVMKDETDTKSIFEITIN